MPTPRLALGEVLLEQTVDPVTRERRYTILQVAGGTTRVVTERTRGIAEMPSMRRTSMQSNTYIGFGSNRAPAPMGSTGDAAARVEPVQLSIPQNYDSGNVRAICYSIDSGSNAADLLKFLIDLRANTKELELVTRLYERELDLPASRKKVMLDAFDRFIKKSGKEINRIPCEMCGKKFIYWNLIDAYVKKAKNIHTSNVKICIKCYNPLKNKRLNCPVHGGALYLGTEKILCPLYPKKCVPHGYCDSAGCLHRHMMSHKGYTERRWRATKRLHSSTNGEIINSNLVTGVEYEVIGKNKETTRTNIFKLGRGIGIDHDTSIDSFHLATELVTPPASGRKLEQMILKSSEALTKDGFIVNAKCGIHIHMDLFRKYGHINVNPDFYKSLLAAYCLFENTFYRLVPQSRQTNPNLRMINANYSNIFLEKELSKRLKFSKIWYRTERDADIQIFRNTKRHDTKKNWANFHSLLRKEGLEIRLMEGTIDAKSILWWIRLHHDFIERVAKEPDLYLRFAEMTKNISRTDSVQRLIDFLKPSPDLLKFINDRKAMHESSTRNTNILNEDSIDRMVRMMQTMQTMSEENINLAVQPLHFIEP